VNEVPEIRISDADRGEVIEVLTRAYGDGRLDLAEFEDRVAQAQNAKVRSDLSPLTEDLPVPVQGNDDVVEVEATAVEPWIGWFRRELAFFLIPPVVCTAIWAMTDFGGYYWPMWVWLGCLAIIAIGIVEGRDPRADR